MKTQFFRYLVRRLRLGATKQSVTSGYPYLKSYNLLGTQFDFWITDPTSQKWYDNDSWDKAVELITITGDSLLREQQLERVNFLKIDVEGYEVQVLEGCRTILSTLPKIDIELHLDFIPGYKRGVEEVFKIIPINKYNWTSPIHKY
jgi:hypothetical protein